MFNARTIMGADQYAYSTLQAEVVFMTQMLIIQVEKKLFYHVTRALFIEVHELI